MSFEADFRALLLGYAPLVALVGDRVSWAELPQARPRPLVTLWNTTRDRPRTLDNRTGYAAAFVQADCWADTIAEAVAVADEITGYLESLKDAVEGGTLFQGVFMQGRQDGNEPTLGSPAARYQRVRLDLTAHTSAP